MQEQIMEKMKIRLHNSMTKYLSSRLFLILIILVVFVRLFININLDSLRRMASIHEKGLTAFVGVPKISVILNSDLIQLTYDKVCKNYSTASVTEDIFNPTFNTKKESIDVGLVITVNYNKLFNIIPIIELLYRPFFQSIHYCGPELDDKGAKTINDLRSHGWNLTLHHPNMTRPLGDSWWALGYLCIVEVQNSHLPRAKTGYLFMGDDVLFPPAHLNRLSLKRAARYPANHVDMSDEHNTMSKGWVHYGGARNAKLNMIDNIGNHSKTEIELFRKCQESLNMFFGHKSPLVVGSADIYYIPARLMKTASMLVRIYAKYEVMLEVAVPEIMECLDDEKPFPQKAETIEAIGDWTGLRGQFWKNPNVKKVLSGEYEAIHPFKTSSLLVQNDDSDDAKQFFCQEILPYLHQ